MIIEIVGEVIQGPDGLPVPMATYTFDDEGLMEMRRRLSAYAMVAWNKHEPKTGVPPMVPAEIIRQYKEAQKKASGSNLVTVND